MFTPSIINWIPRGVAQQSTTPSVTYDKSGWTTEFKKVSMTTPDVGLTFEITMYNNSTQSYDSSIVPLYIYISVVSVPSNKNVFSKYITYDSTYKLQLPPNASSSFFVKVEESVGNPLQIGSYSAQLSCSNSNSLLYGSQGTPIGKYPFNFEVENQDVIDQAYKNLGGAPFINIGPIQITLFEFQLGSSITVISLGLIFGYVWRKRKKR
jgi:hypothetical protein